MDVTLHEACLHLCSLSKELHLKYHHSSSTGAHTVLSYQDIFYSQATLD